MHPMPELSSLLKQLRLSGILDSLEARNREAIDRKLAYTEFLSLLVHDEVARRDQKKLDLRMRRANFRNQKTLEGFDFDRLPGLNRAAVHDLATCRFIEEKVAVIIAGPCGTGKSHLAQALGHAAARQGYDVLFITQTQLMSSLRTAQAMGTYERRFNYLAKIPLLLIDDFGLKPLRPPEDEDFHDLIAERYERTATVLTSNLDLEEWGAAFPANKMIAAATLDRLRHGAYKIELDGESYRGLKPASEQSKPPAAKGRKAVP
ncbi:Mobile element protein [Janthinobacterium sp. CG23_2]|nr:Mobile element protein [Janthinobacterium sp. CG23_2]CUI09260.1 Mobile element protein [Janthinobacterium sp. CG23_2]CUU30179.1 Mobile element protein [Janthinobacterium sp. CG23_2]CUU33046.1 Mobile element protein [Janthinobacterium sp. CG23_2]